MLFELFLRLRNHAHVLVEEDRAARCCPLIDSKYVGHGRVPLWLLPKTARLAGWVPSKKIQQFSILHQNGNDIFVLLWYSGREGMSSISPKDGNNGG